MTTNRTNNPAGTVKNGVHVLRLRVYHEDTDYTGVVYHGSYVRFAERGRSDFLRARGFDHTIMHRTSPAVALMVYRMEIDYLGAARISDVLEVETCVASLTKARLEMAQSIRCGNDVLCRMKVVVVAAIPGSRAQRLPRALVATLERGNSPVES